MKIEKLDSSNFIVVDERIGVSFFAETKLQAENHLIKMGYHRGASDNDWMMPGEIIPDE